MKLEAKFQKGLQFVNAVKGGNVPKEYIPSVEKGFREAYENRSFFGWRALPLRSSDLN
jgi:elongation factor G